LLLPFVVVVVVMMVMAVVIVVVLVECRQSEYSIRLPKGQVERIGSDRDFYCRRPEVNPHAC
jgi:hypothetical protein